MKNIKGKRKNSAEKVKIILLILCPSTRQAAGNMAAGGRRAQKSQGVSEYVLAVMGQMLLTLFFEPLLRRKVGFLPICVDAERRDFAALVDIRHRGLCVGVVEKRVGGGGLHEERNALAALAVAEPLGVDHLAEKEGEKLGKIVGLRVEKLRRHRFALLKCLRLDVNQRGAFELCYLRLRVTARGGVDNARGIVEHHFVDFLGMGDQRTKE